QAGVPAAMLNSSQSPAERAAVLRAVDAGGVQLLYVAPERLVMDGFLERLRRAQPVFVAVDEAHCISQWGHDFRPEYRQLRVLREVFPALAVHAYTATATPQVRNDIVAELRLRDPLILVGSFDRPNLVYRVRPRTDRVAQVTAAINRHRDQAGIVYCIRRSEVDELTAALTRRGLRALRYHAGLTDDERRANQEAFVNERADIVVATVAFGMGIDRSNVRYVIHAAMPKSLEHYQQEAGRVRRPARRAQGAGTRVDRPAARPRARGAHGRRVPDRDADRARARGASRRGARARAHQRRRRARRRGRRRGAGGSGAGCPRG